MFMINAKRKWKIQIAIFKTLHCAIVLSLFNILNPLSGFAALTLLSLMSTRVEQIDDLTLWERLF